MSTPIPSYRSFSPPSNLFTVTIYDPVDNQVQEMYEFIVSSQLSLEKFEEFDVSDFSGSYDVICEYWFCTEKDALLFRLRWSGK